MLSSRGDDDLQGLRLCGIAKSFVSLKDGIEREMMGDQELWKIASDLFESAGVERTNAQVILDRIAGIEGESTGRKALRVLGHILATWHATPDEAIHHQLACIEFLLVSYKSDETMHRLIVRPYFEDYWRHMVAECRFAFRAPDLVRDAIHEALRFPEKHRTEKILCAAAGGFQLRGLNEVVNRLRGSTA